MCGEVPDDPHALQNSGSGLLDRNWHDGFTQSLSLRDDMCVSGKEQGDSRYSCLRQGEVVWSSWLCHQVIRLWHSLSFGYILED